jgi:hypothetical protein
VTGDGTLTAQLMFALEATAAERRAKVAQMIAVCWGVSGSAYRGIKRQSIFYGRYA